MVAVVSETMGCSTGEVMRFPFTMQAVLLASALTAPLAAGASTALVPDLIIYNAKVWTVDERRPVAQAVAVRGALITKVGSSKEVLALKGPATRLMDVQGQLVLPGFNDSHTHFGNAAEWFFQVPLTDVNNGKLMAERVRAVVARVPAGLWITGGDWSAAAAHAHARQGQGAFAPLAPDLRDIDAVSPQHPLIIRRYDHAYFANSAALKLARLSRATPDPAGGSYGKDPVSGELNGMLYGTAGEKLQLQLPPMTLRKRLIGARHIQADLNRSGITSITDMARLDELSEEQLYPFNVERSATDLRIFEGLRKAGVLSLRVNAMLPIETAGNQIRRGLPAARGDEWIRFGTLKAYGDSGVMFKPYTGNGLPGDWSFRFPGEAVIADSILHADRHGFDVGVHIIGDKAVRALIDWYQAAITHNPPRDRRFRLIHAWHFDRDDIRRAGKLGLVADVQPYHLARAVAQMAGTLDEERARSAFAWKSMIDAGIVLSLGSDMPGSFDRLHVAPYSPLENIHAVVTRSDKKGFPTGGWHPEQKLGIKEAIKAYTYNPAYSSREEAIKGSITEGKLADMVVLSKDILTVPPADYLNTRVVATILGGKVLDFGAAP